MKSLSGYVIVTPVRDEVATIEQTIASVITQTVLPLEWIIVNDGSIDGTEEIVARAAKKYSWIRLISIKSRDDDKRSFAAVVENTSAGIRLLQTRSYEYLGLLDADVSFEKNYFEVLINRFKSNSLLGMAGGVVIDLGQPKNEYPRNRNDVPGAVQFFRRDCFEKIGGLIPIPEGGWDSMTCVMARINGYETCLFTDLIVNHLKPRNIAEGGIIRRKWQMGVRDHALGYLPIFELLKCIDRIKNKPYIVGAIAWAIGYCMACITFRPRVISTTLISQVRSEQIGRIRQEVFRPMSRCMVFLHDNCK